MGLAPLMGFLLDALLGGTRLDDALPRAIWRSLPRMEFIMRTAFPHDLRRAGYGLVAWYAVGALLGAWLLSVALSALFGLYGLFVARSLVFFALVSARGLTMRGIEALVRLSGGDWDGARAALSGLPGQDVPDELPALCGAAARHLSGATIGAAFLPLAWGLVGGAPLAAAAVAIAAVAGARHDRPKEEQPLWTAVERAHRVVAWPAAWLGALVLPAVIGVVGGRRSTAFAGFVTATTAAPEDRLAGAVARGFGLGERAGGYVDGPDVAPSDVQKIVQVLFLAGMLAAMAVAAVGCLAIHVL